MSIMFRERGFAIIAGVFILVVFAVLGAAMVSMTSASSEKTTLDVQQAKALRAAQAGMEWGFYQIRKAGTSACTATGINVALDANTLNGFTVTVTCTSVAVNEAGSPTLTQVTSVACNAPAANTQCPGTPASETYVERKMMGIIAK